MESYISGRIWLGFRRMKKLIFLLRIFLCFLLVDIFGMCKLSLNIVVNNVVVVVNAFLGAQGPYDYHSDGPEKKEKEYYCARNEDLIGDVIFRQIVDVLRQRLHFTVWNQIYKLQYYNQPQYFSHLLINLSKIQLISSWIEHFY